ncbi:unnamed protein product, partial [Meganyctiphanes norvegica]
AAAAASAAANKATAAASQQQASAAQLTQATQGAQHSALKESSLAALANNGETAAKNTYNVAVAVVRDLEAALGDASAVRAQALNQLHANEGVFGAQNAMAWRAQQAANALHQQQGVALNDLYSAQGAAGQAQNAANKAIAKAKGSGGYGGGSG